MNNQLPRCEFRGRGFYLAHAETCSGCGAPLPLSLRSGEFVVHNNLLEGVAFDSNIWFTPSAGIFVTVDEAQTLINKVITT